MNFLSRLQKFKSLVPITKRTFSFKAFPLGDFPEELKYDRPYKLTQMSNGIKVCTEAWPSPLASLVVFINCGSRNETPETSGTAHFLEHLHFKGTTKRSREKLELDVENMGGQLNAYTSRENTSYTMNVFKENLSDGLEILGDMLLNSKYDTRYVNSERNTIYAELIETQKEQMESLVEHAHYNIYKDQMMGKPILGRIENMQNITRDMIVDYHNKNYHGDNIYIIGVGDIPSHEAVVELAERHFGKYPKKKLIAENRNKPKFNPGISLIKPDLLQNPPDGINVGIFYDSACWKDYDYYAFLILQRLFADKPQHELEAKIVEEGSFNIFQHQLSQHPDILFQQSLYTPYSDSGLFGSYFYGKTECLDQMIEVMNFIIEKYSKGEIRKDELDRAKNRLYIEILQHETGNDLAQAYGNQILYLNRRVPRSEIAKRISLYSVDDIAESVRKWLLNKQSSVTVWGNIDELEKKYGVKARSSYAKDSE